MWRSWRTTAGGCWIARHRRTVPHVAQLPLCNAARQSSAPRLRRTPPPGRIGSVTNFIFVEQAYGRGKQEAADPRRTRRFMGLHESLRRKQWCVLSIGGKETQVRKAVRSCGEGTVRLVRRRLLGWLASEIRLRNPTALCFHGRSKNGRRNCI